MNTEQLVRDVLREQADGQAPVGPGFADRVLAVRRRRRGRRAAGAAVATAVAVVVAVGVPLLDSGRDDVRPAGVVRQKDLHAHPDQAPPREQIAAGRAVLAAYYTTAPVPQAGGTAVLTHTYWLLDPSTGRYEKDDRWAFVAVAPGARTAAVLERGLPARRVGLLDLATGEVERWIAVERGVGGLAFSRDGSRLLATTYTGHPDLLDKPTVAGQDWTPRFGRSSRTGFLVLGLRDGTARWSAVPAGTDINSREDFAFARDERHVYGRVVGEKDGLQQYYDLAGNKAAPPLGERYLRSDVGARLSPDGTLAAGGLFREPAGTSYSEILDPDTGERIAEVRGAQLLAWADERRLVAWERDPASEAYRGRLVLVTVGSGKVVPLSGYREETGLYRQDWQPVFTTR
ncbi:WD40 repeat domain-containing protein [Streptomyces sp. NPDC088387]|uniref:WD40 repeat domain-containing protein n=1 Tax=Streptomyces sp. NPDC088387 TaxID=3365859 RepID=UPI003804E6CE